MKYTMNIAGLDRDLPLCKVADDLYIGAFVMFGDAEITVACARELLARAPKDYDYLLTAEAKSIPLIHEMARQSGAKTYFIARKGMKVYLTDPIHVTVHSITTQHEQDLYLSGEDAARIRGKRILIVDDVISTGDSLKAMEELVVDAGGTVAGRMAVLAEGDAQNRDDIIYLNPLPLFNADGTVKYDEIEDPLPFDLDAPIVEIGDDDYAVWYRDMSEEPKKYENKVVRFKCRYLKRKKVPAGNFIVGRHVMTCCAEDIQFAGLICQWEDSDSIVGDSWHVLTARVNFKFSRAYGKKGPVLTFIEDSPCEVPEQPVATFY